MEYDFRKTEIKWKEYWKREKVYRTNNPDGNYDKKPKCYVLDMFPYPSGAGLHVGHPLGYIASDIYARYKKLCGYNVLHPMGFDAFGLPAEQYAIETGQHPALTTEKNIARYKEQLDNIGFCYDWDREVRTSNPNYYKWTQWIFLQLFRSWYHRKASKTRPISELTKIFELEGNINHTCPADENVVFGAQEWAACTEQEKRAILMKYRIAYQGYAQVWWCEALGTVLANDEVVNGVSERGSHPVERKNMRQWFLRITEYAERLLTGLDTLDWSEAMKEMQRNWIGKSNGAEVKFHLTPNLAGAESMSITVFTTRPDTIFGIDFMVLAPEHELVNSITTEQQKEAVLHYVHYVKSRSERERMSEVKQVTGCFTGAYVLHPFTEKEVPVWISEYVLAGYGTGAIMGVPSGDDRDHAFAKHFGIEITNIFGDKYTGKEAYSTKAGMLENSDFITGLSIADANEAVIQRLEQTGQGKRKVHYKLRDAGYSRQRYWGEPFPIVYIDDVPYGTDELANLSEKNEPQDYMVELPHVDSYRPGPEGEGPLANIPDWVNLEINVNGETKKARRETNTMPGYAGSSWYFLRYMDPHNALEFAGKDAINYWQQVDLYIGGNEHAVGHLLYSRMWTKALHDLTFINFEEPFKKLLNQGMILGSSRFAYRFDFKLRGQTVGVEDFAPIFVSKKYATSSLTPSNHHIDSLVSDVALLGAVIAGSNQLVNYTVADFISFQIHPIRVDVNCVDGVELNVEAFKNWRPEYANADFVLDEGKYICGAEIEKMSKSKYNVVNPDEIIAQYGADTFRMYEMFLGPIDVSKPWDTKGIEGVYRFLKKMWRLYMDEQKGWLVTDEKATDAELKILHKTIKKTGDDIEKFSFNTAVSQFMICVNELNGLNCHKREVLEPLAVTICSFAPHMAEELWHQLGHTNSVTQAVYPGYDEKYLRDDTKMYPVAVNGKTRIEMEFAIDAEQHMVQEQVLADPGIQKWMEGKSVKKFIFVKGKMINVVV